MPGGNSLQTKPQTSFTGLMLLNGLHWVAYSRPREGNGMSPHLVVARNEEHGSYLSWLPGFMRATVNIVDSMAILSVGIGFCIGTISWALSNPCL